MICYHNTQDTREEFPFGEFHTGAQWTEPGYYEPLCDESDEEGDPEPNIARRITFDGQYHSYIVTMDGKFIGGGHYYQTEQDARDAAERIPFG